MAEPNRNPADEFIFFNGELKLSCCRYPLTVRANWKQKTAATFCNRPERFYFCFSVLLVKHGNDSPPCDEISRAEGLVFPAETLQPTRVTLAWWLPADIVVDEGQTQDQAALEGGTSSRPDISAFSCAEWSLQSLNIHRRTPSEIRPVSTFIS